MKKASIGTMLLLVCASTSFVHAQDQANGEKLFKTKCAGCHGANGEGKAAMKSPSIKGKSADDITKAFASSPKHASVKSLAPAGVKDLAAYLATLN
jgi:mono/diheme cytochrome c family protein